MNSRMSTILDQLGLNVSLWHPLCDQRPEVTIHGGCNRANYSDPQVLAAAKADWRSAFESMPRIDTLFINAGVLT